MASNSNSLLNKYLLLVDVRRGFELPKGSYVKVIVEKQEQKTTINKDSDNPIWNEKMLFRFDHIPDQIEIRVKHERSLLPNNKIGEYIIDIHSSSNQDLTKPIKLVDGVLNLDNTSDNKGKLDVKITLHNINELNAEQYEFKNDNIKQELLQELPQETTANKRTLTETTSSLSSSSNEKEEIIKDVNTAQTGDVAPQATKEELITEEKLMNNNDNNINNNINNDNNINNNEIITSTPSQIQMETTSQKIIEQPVEIYRRIIHVEKPKIIEVPIYKEIHEYVREEPQYITQDANVIQQDLGIKDVSQLNEEEINRLKQYAYASNNDNNNNNDAEIILEKEQVTLAPEIRELPPQVHEKEIIYEQPIEIERRHIETIKPTIHEQVKIFNEHVTMKTEPETKIADAVIINQGDQYFTKDTRDTTNQSNINTMENINANSNQITNESIISNESANTISTTKDVDVDVTTNTTKNNIDNIVV